MAWFETFAHNELPEEEIVANADSTTVVRVSLPAKASRAELLASLSAWLDHQCILVADLRLVSLSTTEGIFDAAFDNPRDARLFARRFAGQPITSPTPPRTDRNYSGRLLQFRGKLKAQGDVHPSDAYASAIAGARGE